MAAINAQVALQLRQVDRQLNQLSRRFDTFFKKVERSSSRAGNNSGKAFQSSFQGVFAGLTVDRILQTTLRGLSDVTQQSIELAQVARGVEPAFQNLNNPALLSNLRAATRGAVGDIFLMQQALQATNLGIAQNDLSTFFDFASRRAIETGRDVTQQLDSIVRGIAFKSVRVLDNVGIAPERLRAALGGVSLELASIEQVSDAVGRIIQEEMGSGASAVDELAVASQKLDASFENLQVTIGKKLQPSVGAFQLELAKTSDNLNLLIEDSEGGAFSLSSLASSGSDFLQVFTGFAAVSTLINNSAEGLQDFSFEFDRLARNFKGFVDSAPGEVFDFNSDGLAELLKKQEEAAKAAAKEAERAAKAYQSQLKSLRNIAAQQEQRLQLELEIGRAVANQDFITAANGLSATVPSESETAAFADSLFPVEQADELGEKFEAIIKSRMERSAHLIEQGNELINNAIQSGAVAIGEGIGQMIAGFENGFNGVIGVFSEFVKSFGKLLIQYGVAVKALNAIKINPIAAIAAGIALVAIGSAIQGTLERGPSLAIGTNEVLSDGIAQIHRGEAIVPARVAQGGFDGLGGPIEVVGRLLAGDIYLSSVQGAKQMGRRQ